MNNNKPTSASAKVVPLLFEAGADLEDEPEPSIPIAPVTATARPAEAPPVELDLSSRNKALFLIGPRRLGKDHAGTLGCRPDA